LYVGPRDLHRLKTMTRFTLLVAVLVGGFALGRASSPAPNPFTPEETRAAREYLRQERLLRELRKKFVEDLAPLGVTVK
jgi:hypothetical protein